MKALARLFVSACTLLLIVLVFAGCGTGKDSPGNDASGTSPEQESAQNAERAAGSEQALWEFLHEVRPMADSISTSSVDELSEAISALATSIQGYNRAQNSDRNRSGTTLSGAGEVAQQYGWKIFQSILLLIATYYLVKGLTIVLDKVSETNAKRRLFYKRLVPIFRVLIWSASLYVIVKGVFEVNNQSLLAAGAAIGVAVGFASQDIVKNIFGGFVIISDRPFQVGDKILIDGTYGEVTAIGLRSTRIVTPDDSVVSVPNAQVISSQVSNANAGALDCQVVTDLYLPGWVDEEKAKRIAFEAAATSKYVFLKKPITVLVKDEFRETFITHIKVKAYVLDTRYEFLLMSDITERARHAFREAGLIKHMHGARAVVDLVSVPYGSSEIGKTGRASLENPAADNPAVDNQSEPV